MTSSPWSCQHCTLVGHRTYDFNSCHVLLACSQMQGLLPQRRIGCADSRNLESLIASLHSWAKISSFEAMPGSTQQRFPLQRLCSFSGFWQLHPFCAQCTLLVSLKSVAVWEQQIIVQISQPYLRFSFRSLLSSMTVSDHHVLRFPTMTLHRVSLRYKKPALKSFDSLYALEPHNSVARTLCWTVESLSLV